MTQIILPIQAKIHYDDISKLWGLKISREEENTGDNVPWTDTLEKFLTLAELILFLLQYWAASGTNPATTKVNAPIGDLAALSAQIVALTAYPVVDISGATGGPPAYPGADPGLNPVVTDWGVT